MFGRKRITTQNIHSKMYDHSFKNTVEKEATEILYEKTMQQQLQTQLPNECPVCIQPQGLFMCSRRWHCIFVLYLNKFLFQPTSNIGVLQAHCWNQKQLGIKENRRKCFQYCRVKIHWTVLGHWEKAIFSNERTIVIKPNG